MTTCEFLTLAAHSYGISDDLRYSLFPFFIYLFPRFFFEKYNCIPRIEHQGFAFFFGSENMWRHVSVCKFVPAVLGYTQWARPKTQLAAAK